LDHATLAKYALHDLKVTDLFGVRGRLILRRRAGDSAAADPARGGADAGRSDRLEVGDATRFATAEKLAAYAGTTPRVHASGGKTRFGPSRPDVNRYLKWAFVEAANSICLTRGRTAPRHVSRLYERVARRKATRRRSGRWPDIWPRRRTGC
jgi:transposase